MNKQKTILQITAGRGPHECTWVVAQVLREILKEANAANIKTQIIHKINGQLPNTVASVFIEFEGGTQGFFQEWIGTIQWIGQSPFRKFHKRKNWFIGIFQITDIQPITFDEKDIHFQAVRSAGAGGQHVNKVSSAVRATHKPTGMQVLAMDTRSQLQNKKLAIERLKEKIQSTYYEELAHKQNAEWMNTTAIERGNPVRTFTITNR